MIVFPMCGESKRFKVKGYKTPKFLLKLRNKSIFYHVVYGFKNISIKIYLYSLLIIKVQKFLLHEFRKLELTKYKIITLKNKTNGQLKQFTKD